MINFRQAKLHTTAARIDQCPPDGLPEVVLAGKSNVGKSSLINTLTGQRRLARTSQVPGKTRLLNFFQVDERFFLVDLPGYGFARAGKEEKKAYSRLTDSYLAAGRPICLLISLLDIRHEPTRQDLQMIEWLARSDLNCLPVLTKADKLSRAQAGRMRQKIARAAGLESTQELIIFSAVSGQGTDELRQIIQMAVESCGPAGLVT